MSLSSVSIKRPVLAIVLSLSILLFGILGYNFLGVREFPSVDPPIVNVSTSYVGANADVIETQITENLEQSINGIAGIRSLFSSSRDGSSRISVEFELGVDMEAAANDVRDRVSRAQYLLPADVNPPIVSKADADATAIAYVGLRSGRLSLLELTDIADRILKERLQTIAGVSEVQIWGERRFAMRIYLQGEKLIAHQITPVDIRNALQKQNIELPSGKVEGAGMELSVRTSGRLVTVDDFNRLIIKEDNRGVVRLQDIATVQLAPENEKTISRMDGVPVVGVVIVPQPGTNQIDIADEYYKRLEEISKDLPADVEMIYGFDDTRFVRRSIQEVIETIGLAFVLVVVIIFIFLRNWRTTLIPVLAIPVSLIGSFFIMYIFGFSINVLSLLGIVLAIGLVVDDAIVVMENIYTKIEAGMPPKEAAYVGSSEIFFAVVSTTLTLVAVFLPVIFLQGMTGRLFREFGIVIAGAVIISSFVALTLSPMMCAYLLKQSNPKKSRIERLSRLVFDKISLAYQHSLNSFMRKPYWAAVIIILSFILMIFSFKALKSELAPLEDRDTISLSVTAQEGYTFEMMDAYVLDLLDLINKVVYEEERESVLTNTSPSWGSGASNSASVRILLKPAAQRQRSQKEIADILTKEVKKLNSARVLVNQPPTISVGRGGGAGGTSIQYVIQAQNHAKLREFLPLFLQAVNQDGGFVYADANLKYTKPEMRIEINREKANDLQVSVLDIAQTLQFGLSGQRYGYFVMNGKQYQVIGQLDRNYRSKPADISSLYLRNRQGNLVQMDNLVTIEEQANPPQLYRYNRYASATITAQLAPGVSMGEGIEKLDAISSEVLDDSFQTTLMGQAKEMQDSSGSMVYALLLSLVLIYLTLSAQFESFRDPLIIMFTVPLALAGALISLWWFRQTLNIFSQIGIIMLIGLVTKNGILIVEFANQRKEAGLPLKKAVLDAAVSRFRPILMTSLATIFGILPIALAFGAGSESRVSMGIAVTGGMTIATLLTLYVVPVVYTWFSKPLKIVSKNAILPLVASCIFFASMDSLSAQNDSIPQKNEKKIIKDSVPILCLDSALVQALANNYDIRIAAAQAEQDVLAAHPGAANMLPSLMAQGKWQNTPANTNLSSLIALDWTIFDGFKMFAAYGRLKEIADMGEFQYRAAVEGTLLQVYTFYYNIALLQQQLEVVKQSMEVSRQRFVFIQDKEEVGRASMLEVYNAKVDFFTDSAMYMRHKESLQRGKIELNQILGRDVNIVFSVHNIISVDAGLDFNNIRESALADNINLLIARSQVEIAAKIVKEANSGYYPVVGLNAGYNYGSSVGSASQNTNNNGIYYGAGISWNLFNGLQQYRNAKIAKIGKDIADLSYQQQELYIESQLQKGYLNYQSNIQITAIEAENMNTAKKNMDISLERYRLGMLTALELREAQRNYLDANTRLLSSLFQTKLSEIELRKMAGWLAITNESSSR